MKIEEKRKIKARHLEIKQLKEQSEILKERLNDRETALDETLQRLTDDDCSAIKPSEN